MSYGALFLGARLRCVLSAAMALAAEAPQARRWLLRQDSPPLAPSAARCRVTEDAWETRPSQSEGMAPQARFELATLRLTATLFDTAGHHSGRRGPVLLGNSSAGGNPRRPGPTPDCPDFVPVTVSDVGRDVRQPPQDIPQGGARTARAQEDHDHARHVRPRPAVDAGRCRPPTLGPSAPVIATKNLFKVGRTRRSRRMDALPSPDSVLHLPK